MVNALALDDVVTAPVKGEPPVNTITATQYTGVIVWKEKNGSDLRENFAASTVYQAVLTLTVNPGFTFTGVGANSFSYSGAEVENAEGNGDTITVTITFLDTISPIRGDQVVRYINNVRVPFRYVPAGSFMLNKNGTSASPPDLTMTISEGYWMGKTEVTQELFAAVMGTNPSNVTDNLRPVENVNWYAAIAFCNKLSHLEGKDPVYNVSGIDWANFDVSTIPTSFGSVWDAATMDTGKNGYRLPTEMEWMWAAMGADTSEQPNTDGYMKAFAGSDGSNSIDYYAWYGNPSGTTHEVGKKEANELGLYDMSGNVWEWCWDWHGSYPTGVQTDYTGAPSGPYRVFRGGGWDFNASNCAVAYRYFNFPDSRSIIIGFRVVCP